MEQRERWLLRELLDQEGPVTIGELAAAIRACRRTVQDDLDRLAEFLRRFPGVALHRQPRRGVWLEAPPDFRRQWTESGAAVGETGSGSLAPADRQRRLVGLLLMGGGPTTIERLANELFFSRVTIQKDLERVARWLAAYGLTLHRRPRRGLELTGPESAWRRAVAEYLVESSAPGQILRFLREVCPVQARSGRLDSGSAHELARLFPSLNMDALEEALRAAELEMGCDFTDEAYAGLVVHLAISIERLRQSKEICMPPEQLADLSTRREWELGLRLARRLESVCGLAFPAAEVGYITLHLLGAKVQANLTQPDELVETLACLDPAVVDLTRRMVALAEKALGLPLSDDMQLLAGLALHLRPTVSRLQNGLSLRNPVLDDLKEAYPSVMAVAWLAASILEQQAAVVVSEEEVGYLALHLGAAVERARQRRRVLLVCGSGIGSAQLVASRLSAYFPDLEIAGVVPSLSVQRQDPLTRAVDLIITTVPVADAPVPVVRIHPLLPEPDLQRLARHLGGMGPSGHPAAPPPPGPNPLRDLERLLGGRLLRLCLSAGTRRGVIAELGRTLVDAGYVLEGYVQSVLRREETTSTAIGKGVAIPHGEARYTRKAAMAVGVLAQPVDWGGESVDVVFLLALDPRQPTVVESAAQQLYRLLQSDDALDCLRRR